FGYPFTKYRLILSDTLYSAMAQFLGVSSKKNLMYLEIFVIRFAMWMLFCIEIKSELPKGEY
ncbi:MAG: hypothetical protein JW749_01300, partial [Sedimentisphaerales bacterium]|nr:hypothetical protein [Sedimentisphaerales bacterium]